MTTRSTHQKPALTRVAEGLLPAWWNLRPGDPRHPRGRRYTRRYRAKRGLVRDLWPLACAPMLLWPTPQTVVPMLLGMTCLSFRIPDEADEQHLPVAITA